MSEPLDFRLRDYGSYYRLEPQTEAARRFMEDSGLDRLRYDHDNWLKVAVELNRHGYTVKVD